MEFKTFKGRIEQKEEVALKTYSIKIVDSEGGTFDFTPGQFATLTLGENVKRSYSVASIPGKPYIELIADTWKGGPGSQFFEKAQIGDSVEFLFPLGHFVLRESQRPAHFFATGTGIVPFMSMIEHSLITLGNTTKEFVLYSGFRHEEDVFGKGLLEMLDVRFENFKYKLNLTQPKEGYQGNIGRITQYIDTLTSTDIDAYICGSNQMVTDVKARLIAKGVPAEQVFNEMYY
ncbi:MAG TPA: FAD-binding oxidoreductase [Candidatus Dojkabacteria bacterium]|nr:FAD-binding oxidoreductase [Candidatus Dojkabacteria bacterium]